MVQIEIEFHYQIEYSYFPIGIEMLGNWIFLINRETEPIQTERFFWVNLINKYYK